MVLHTLHAQFEVQNRLEIVQHLPRPVEDRPLHPIDIDLDEVWRAQDGDDLIEGREKDGEFSLQMDRLTGMVVWIAIPGIAGIHRK
jgi:hypothetical protein